MHVVPITKPILLNGLIVQCTILPLVPKQRFRHAPQPKTCTNSSSSSCCTGWHHTTIFLLTPSITLTRMNILHAATTTPPAAHAAVCTVVITTWITIPTNALFPHIMTATLLVTIIFYQVQKLVWQRKIKWPWSSSLLGSNLSASVSALDLIIPNGIPTQTKILNIQYFTQLLPTATETS